MRKEIFTAVFVGVLLGLVVTYGIYTANKALVAKSRGNTPQTTTIPTPTPSPQPLIDLTISTPAEDNLVTDKDTYTIEGSTLASAAVAIVTDDNAVLTEADAHGKFSHDIPLVKGANTIEITASDTNQISATRVIHIVYTTELENK